MVSAHLGAVADPSGQRQGGGIRQHDRRVRSCFLAPRSPNGWAVLPIPQLVEMRRMKCEVALETRLVRLNTV